MSTFVDISSGEKDWDSFSTLVISYMGLPGIAFLSE